MLWRDFSEQECCDGCPLLDAEICNGGWSSYGGVPAEPPCCSFDDDTDLNEWVSDYFDRKRKREAQEDARIRAERAKKERAKKAADTRRAMQWYCRGEIRALKSAQKELDAQRSAERMALSLAEAINITNEMFRYTDRVAVRPEMSELVQQLETKVSKAKEKYEAKRKEFYAKLKGGEK